MDLLQLSERSEAQFSPASVSKELVLGQAKCIDVDDSFNGVNDPMGALQTLLDQEKKHYRSQCLQGLKNPLFTKGNEKPAAVLKWFSSMTEWCFAVVDGYCLPPQTVEIAMNILDRYILFTCKSTDPSERQS